MAMQKSSGRVIRVFEASGDRAFYCQVPTTVPFGSSDVPDVIQLLCNITDGGGLEQMYDFILCICDELAMRSLDLTELIERICGGSAIALCNNPHLAPEALKAARAYGKLITGQLTIVEKLQPNWPMPLRNRLWSARDAMLAAARVLQNQSGQLKRVANL